MSKATRSQAIAYDIPFFTQLQHFYATNRGRIRQHYRELTEKYLDFNDPANAKAFLRKPQFEALEMYVFLKEFFDNRPVHELFRAWADRYTSFTYKQFGNGATLDNGCLVLSKIGRVAVRWSRPLAGTPKPVTLSHEADGWYACSSCAEVPTQPLPPAGKETGVAVGLKVFLITAGGDAAENPRHHRKAEMRLKTAPRRVSRRRKGSKRRRKAVALLKRAHQRARRQRRDFHHKTANTLLRQYDASYLEDLRVANLARNHRLAKSIADAGWAQFRTILEGTAVYAGRQVVAVPPRYTSQDCSGCGGRVPKSLSVRTHVCASCGLVIDRDENAAQNIQWAGQALRGGAAVAAAGNRESPAL